MTHKTKNTLFALTLCGVLCMPQYPLHALETYTVGTIMTTATFRWNNENWFTEPHPKVISFTIQDDGSAYGLTETGVSFVQENVANALGIRVQRFSMQDHYHYIIDGKDVYTFEELSMELARIYSKGTQA